MMMPQQRLASRFVLVLACAGCGPVIRGAVEQPGPVACPDVVELGHVAPRGTATGAFTLSNASTEAVEVVQIESSCPCLLLDPMRPRLLPGASQPIRVRFDAAEEPDFRGALSINLAGFGTNKRELFRTRVAVVVDPG